MSTSLIGLVTAGVSRDAESSADLSELRQASLSVVSWATVGLAVLVVLVPDPLLARSLLPNGFVSCGLLASVLLGLVLRQHSLTAASIALVAGLGLSLIVAVDAFSADPTIPWLGLFVLVSAALLGRRGGLAAGFAASVFLTVVLPGLPIVATPSSIAGAEAMVWASVALSWLITQPLYIALDWSWHGYQQAVERTREAERHRGELAGALKELGEACRRLEDANHELARARQAADEARKLRERFAAFVSHEIRLPLNIITGFSEMMVMSPTSYDGQVLPDAYRADVEAIYRAAYQLSSLVDDVLDLSEIDAHQMGLQKEWISLGEVLDQASVAARGLFQGKGLSFGMDVPRDLPKIYADCGRIRQVVLNLLKNAVRFTDFGGARIEVALRDDRNEVVIAVEDTGIGIAADDLDHVFDEFRQLDAAGRRRFGGSGLGLAICKRFVEMHGGNVWVESRPGHGSTFAFSLPVCSNVAAVPYRGPWNTWVRPTSVGEPTVAVIGEDSRSVHLLQRYLEGYRVLGLADASALAQTVAAEPVCAAIVVGATGRKIGPLARQVGAIVPALPVVACVVHSGRASAVQALGVADYLRKPVDRRSVARALSTIPSLERLVVVDDDPDMLRLLASMVRSACPEAQISLTGDGAAALALIDAQHPQAVLLDLVMPGIDGYAVIQELRANGRLRDLAVIAVTAGTGSVETLTAEISQVTRASGLTAGEFTRCLRGMLNSLLAVPGVP